MKYLIIALVFALASCGAAPRYYATGDSLTAGMGATVAYPAQLQEHLGERVVNLGVSGQQLAQMEPAHVAGTLIVWAGTNDLFFGASAATTLNRLRAYLERSTAERIIVLTVLPRANEGTAAGFEERRQAYNAAIRHVYGGMLIDVAGDQRLQDPYDERYYSKDRVHLNDAGYAIIAAKIVAVLR